MKILQISHRVPWPLNEGGTIGIYNYTKGYALAGHEVTLLALDGKKHNTNKEEALQVLSQFAQTTLFEIDTDVKPIPALLNLFGNQSYNVIRFYSDGFKRLIETKLKAEKFDVIQIEGTYAAMYVHAVLPHIATDTLLVLRQHNVEHQIWERLASNTRNPVKKWYLKLLAIRLKQFETNYLNQFDLVVPVTDDDGAIFKQLGCTKPIVTSPAGIDTTLWKPSSTADIMCCYHLGSLEWMPNQEAMRWFVEEIWPSLKNKFPALRFYLAGKNMPAYFKQLQVDGIEVIESVPDAAAFVADKGINIVPLLSGSGIRLKILEAMSAGKIVISTTIGAQGIHCTHQKDIFIADDVDAFISAFEIVLNSLEKTKQVQIHARELIMQQYANQSVINRLLEVFHKNISIKRSET